MQKSSAQFILKLKERRVSQVAIDDIVDGSKKLFSNETLIRVKANMKAKMAESGVDPDSITGSVMYLIPLRVWKRVICKRSSTERILV